MYFDPANEHGPMEQAPRAASPPPAPAHPAAAVGRAPGFMDSVYDAVRDSGAAAQPQHASAGAAGSSPTKEGGHAPAGGGGGRRRLMSDELGLWMAAHRQVLQAFQ
jgi:hypothetical protein